jgi:ABC-2 type transport system ATP-binding protein
MPEANIAPVVKAGGLSKIFRDFWGRPKAKAVNDIDFQINRGEVIGLLGPNGSGKSTIVKMLLGLLYPTAGSISIFGKSPRDVYAKKEIGYLPEETYLYKYLTAAETLDFFGALFNLSRQECQHRRGQLLEMVGLSHARRRPVGEFSKGMARRIGLAQAMVNDPALLILDEPTSGLDPLGCREVKDLIRLLKKRGKTVLVTSHLLSDVEDVCDRVIILYGGKIRATGTLAELLTIPEESTITTPLLKPGVTEKLLEILRANLKGEEFKVEHPRKTLEQFFLEVINTAKTESPDTAGVSGGGRVADYLTAASEEKSDGIELINQLAEKSPGKQEETRKELEDKKIEEIKHSEEIQKRDRTLKNLTAEKTSEEKKPASLPSDSPDRKEDRKSELKRANEKLSDLLGDSK